VIELSEQTILDQLVDRLALRFLAVSGDQVAAVVRACYSRFDGRPIRDYVPLFVERGARSRLSSAVSRAQPTTTRTAGRVCQ
jgi:hypothetical protein